MLSNLLPEGINQGVIIRIGGKFLFEDDKACTRSRMVARDNLKNLLASIKFAYRYAKKRGEDVEVLGAIVADKQTIIQTMRMLNGKIAKENLRAAA